MGRVQKYPRSVTGRGQRPRPPTVEGSCERRFCASQGLQAVSHRAASFRDGESAEKERGRRKGLSTGHRPSTSEHRNPPQQGPPPHKAPAPLAA